MSQYELVLKHLQKKSITSMEAFGKYGITRLSAVIYNLRADGYEIATTEKTSKNRYGNACTYAVYSLKK